MKKIGIWIGIAGLTLAGGKVLWEFAKDYAKWEENIAAPTVSSSVRGEDSDSTAPPPAQNPAPDEPTTSRSTEREDRWPWSFVVLLALIFLGPSALSVLRDFVGALETKWSQRPPDRPAH